MILAANHLSYMDIFAMALFSHRAGRYPVFLAKSTLFDIPVHRHDDPRRRPAAGAPRRDRRRARAEQMPRQAVRNGACVIFYPEATVTRDPAQWPMVAKTGVARLALTTGAPVVPVAHWGAQEILPLPQPPAAADTAQDGAHARRAAG